MPIKLPSNILIGIPIYNECHYIEEVLTSVSKYSQKILVIDDGSTDGTSQLIDDFAWVQRITHYANMGYGQSLVDIFEYAKQHQYHWVITMDCDHQHQPSCLTKFYDSIQDTNADIISGSRYLKTDSITKSIPVERLRINQSITKLINRTLKRQLTDAFCGFKAYRVESLRGLYLKEKGYGMPLELWIQAAKNDLVIQEIPVPLIYHDPTRNFAGRLEDPKVRLNYYLDIIEQNLILHGYKNITQTSCS